MRDIQLQCDQNSENYIYVEENEGDLRIAVCEDSCANYVYLTKDQALKLAGWIARL